MEYITRRSYHGSRPRTQERQAASSQRAS